jgi:hypothetical protein
MQELLPVPYFHLVFTLPSEFRALVGANQKIGYHVIFKAAAESLMQLAEDERYVGAKIGILAVLHTWGRAMVYHPHVHMLVPGVGLSKDGAMLYFSRKAYLVPVKALSRLFRSKFIAMITSALPDQRIPGIGRDKAWVVFCKHLDLGPEKAIAYLGRYLNRVAIGDDCVRRAADGNVLVNDKGRGKAVRLSTHEFLRRYLQHVLPKGLNKVRRYGLFAPGCLKTLSTLRCQLLLALHTKMAIMAALAANRNKIPENQKPRRCPKCGTGLMMRALLLPPSYCSRAPPTQLPLVP